LAPATVVPVAPGSTVTLLTPPVNGGFSITIPKGFAGQTYVVLTTCNESVSDDTTAAGPAILQISN
ncbi:hypothetical protein M431DRAFT_11968, partial [Trichoderma harzianum CBS 226.95]